MTRCFLLTLVSSPCPNLHIISDRFYIYARPELRRREGRRIENANARRSFPHQNIVISLFFSFYLCWNLVKSFHVAISPSLMVLYSVGVCLNWSGDQIFSVWPLVTELAQLLDCLFSKSESQEPMWAGTDGELMQCDCADRMVCFTSGRDVSSLLQLGQKQFYIVWEL